LALDRRARLVAQSRQTVISLLNIWLLQAAVLVVVKSAAAEVLAVY
jgi:hypothetical protein